MLGEWTNERWEDAIRAVFRRALMEPHFRQIALKDPRGAFAQATGVQAPEEARFRFVETLDEQVLVLPKTVIGQGNLSEIDISRILHHALRHQPITPVMVSLPRC